MAKIIPNLNRHTPTRMTSGERRLVEALGKLLEDDYLVRYGIPVGKLSRHPSRTAAHPVPCQRAVHSSTGSRELNCSTTT